MQMTVKTTVPEPQIPAPAPAVARSGAGAWWQPWRGASWSRGCLVCGARQVRRSWRRAALVKGRATTSRALQVGLQLWEQRGGLGVACSLAFKQGLMA